MANNLGKSLEELLKIVTQELEREWSRYLGSVEYAFPALIIRGKFFTLDGEKEITDNRYIKWSEFECLSEEEKKYIIYNYHVMSKRLNDIEGILTNGK